MLPPAAHPSLLVMKRISRMGQAVSRVRPDHVSPPSAVRCTQPSTVGEMVPPPTHPNWSSWKNVGAPRLATVVAPAKEPPPIGVVEPGDDDIVLRERVDAVPVVGVAQVHDPGPGVAAVSGLPHLAELPGDVADGRAGERDVLDHR